MGIHWGCQAKKKEKLVMKGEKVQGGEEGQYEYD